MEPITVTILLGLSLFVVVTYTILVGKVFSISSELKIQETNFNHSFVTTNTKYEESIAQLNEAITEFREKITTLDALTESQKKLIERSNAIEQHIKINNNSRPGLFPTNNVIR